MKLSQGHHLAYCTNVHRGNNWRETFYSLEKYVLEVRKSVCPLKPYAIGLRLGADAARELLEPKVLRRSSYGLINKMSCFYHQWISSRQLSWTTCKRRCLPSRLDGSRASSYTLSLFQILSYLLPKGMDGSVSTLPASFKEFHLTGRLPESAFEHLLNCAEEIENLSQKNGQDLHLGLEPEPLGWFETIPETIEFINELCKLAEDPEMVRRRIGVNYDCCHLALEYENPRDGLNALKDAGIRLSKIHLSSALVLSQTRTTLLTLENFVEEVYLHQVITAKNGAVVARIKDLDLALKQEKQKSMNADEWRVHFHVPLHASPENGLGDTREHVLMTMDWLAENPDTCTHLEMETYTWEVLPQELRSIDVVEQVIKEYQWTLDALKQRGSGHEIFFF